MCACSGAPTSAKLAGFVFIDPVIKLLWTPLVKGAFNTRRYAYQLIELEK